MFADRNQILVALLRRKNVAPKAVSWADVAQASSTKSCLPNALAAWHARKAEREAEELRRVTTPQPEIEAMSPAEPIPVAPDEPALPIASDCEPPPAEE